jgi:hypothetical protein
LVYGDQHPGREPRRRSIVAADGAFEHKADLRETATDIVRKRKAAFCDKRA